MKENYLKPILVLGVVLPFTVILLVALVVNSVRSSKMKHYRTKLAAYNSEQALFSQITSLKSQIEDKQATVSTSSAVMTTDAYQNISNLIGEEIANSDTKTMVLVEQNRIKDANAENHHIDSQIDGIRFSVRGTFSELQKALLTIEYAYPNLFATQCSIKPEGKLLEANLNYLIWTSGNN